MQISRFSFPVQVGCTIFCCRMLASKIRKQKRAKTNTKINNVSLVFQIPQKVFWVCFGGSKHLLAFGVWTPNCQTQKATNISLEPLGSRTHVWKRVAQMPIYILRFIRGVIKESLLIQKTHMTHMT